MRKILLVVSILLCTYSVSNAQKMILSKAEISNVRYNIYYNKVYVKFDIIKAKKGDLFNVSIKAFNDSDGEIVMSSVSGDLDRVSPGISRTIIWHIDKDLFQINENVFFEISAELLTPNVLQPIDKNKAYLYSTIFPGIGTYRLSGKKYHLVKGMVSYTLVSASIYSKVQANNFYDNYLQSTDVDERSDYYTKSNEKLKRANIFAMGAASIWLLEYANIYLAKNKVLNNNVELGLKIDEINMAPLFSLNLKF